MVAASFRAGTIAITHGHVLNASCFARSSSNARNRQNAPRAKVRYTQMASEMEATASEAEGTGHCGATRCATTTETAMLEAKPNLRCGWAGGGGACRWPRRWRYRLPGPLRAS